MFIGHYGVAFGAKRLAPRTSLGTLSFAAQFLDELWPLLLLTGLEQARVVPGLMAASAIDFVSYPFSHSLAMAVVWGAVVGGVYYALRRSARAAVMLALVVVSHWMLDLPMHRPDLPLWPGAADKFGGGIWNSVPLTLLLDVGVFVAGLVWYVRGTRAIDRIGTWGLWTMVALLGAFTMGNLFGPPPADSNALAFGALGLWLFVPWTWWVDRHRVPRVTPREDVTNPVSRLTSPGLLQ